MDFITIHPLDTVQVAVGDGHKYARQAIARGAPVIKYGYPIGTATRDIPKGGLVHSHNLRTNLGELLAYTYSPGETRQETLAPLSVSAFVREDGEIGIRNGLWIIPTVGCVNKIAERLSRETGALHLSHPYGCSQLGADLGVTQKTLCGLIRHPNAGGVLVLGLGCENNNITELKKVLGVYNPKRVRFLNVQDCGDEIVEGTRILSELRDLAAADERQEVPISRLKVGLKCGGSDGLSGITANPLVGKVTDTLTAMGATAVLTEVPEMFGAEQLFMNRCVSETLFQKTVDLVNGYKQYFSQHGQPVSENPSPGNKAGGITTLEEKSLGCVQKGGHAPVTAVLGYGERACQPGLTLLDGPGNDMVAVTNLTAAGCHMILFTTGRGTPLGAPVPTVKISTNTALAQKKPHWIDFDAGRTLKTEELSGELLQYIRAVAGGKSVCNEENGFQEIAIFKDGVTL